MRKFVDEFKAFALRGNVLDMAVGIIIGGAFSNIVSSLTDNLINPLLGLAGSADLSQLALQLGGCELKFGAFLSSVINFFIMALVLFSLLKFSNKLKGLWKKPEAPKAPATKKCPYCCSEIPAAAVKCAHCASDLPHGED